MIKYTELEESLDKNCILLLTETQLKVDKITTKCIVKKIDSMRKEQDKKGGGISAFYRTDSQCIKEVNEITTKSADILYLELKTENETYKIIVVYFSILDISNRDRNREIRREIEKIVEENNDKLLIIGDFNGHIDGLGYQKQDERGNMVMEWLENYNLILLNTDDRCEGLITWERGLQNRAIDF